MREFGEDELMCSGMTEVVSPAGPPRDPTVLRVHLAGQGGFSACVILHVSEVVHDSEYMLSFLKEPTLELKGLRITAAGIRAPAPFPLKFSNQKELLDLSGSWVEADTYFVRGVIDDANRTEVLVRRFDSRTINGREALRKELHAAEF